MKKKPCPQSAYIISRVLIALASCICGLLLALLAVSPHRGEALAQKLGRPETTLQTAEVESEQTQAPSTIGTCDTAGPIEVEASAGVPGPVAYPNLAAAISAINAGTHQGAISVEICANTTETGGMFLNSSGAGAASYASINIYPLNDDLTISGPTVTGRGLIELNGADNITVDGDNPNSPGINRNLSIRNTAPNTVTFTSVIRIALNTADVTGANNITIKNLNLIGSSIARNISTANSTSGTENTSYGILATGSASAATTAPNAISSVATTINSPATASNLTIQNNNIITAARAVAVQGAATTVFPGLLIQDNLIGNPTAGAVDQVTALGITAQGTSDGIIRRNTVYYEGFLPSGSSSGVNCAINLGGVSPTGTLKVEKNTIGRARNNNAATWPASGISLSGGNNHVVQNNFIVDVENDQTAGTGAFGSNFGAYGIRVAAGTGHRIYHNSVYLCGAIPGATSTDLTAAFLIVNTSSTGMDIRNNIFANLITGGNPTQTNTRHVAIALPSAGTSAMAMTLNNNDYVEGADINSRMAQVGTNAGSGEYTAVNFDPLSIVPSTNFRAYTNALSVNGTNDNSSKKADPLVVSCANLHLTAGSPMIDAAIDVGVTDDKDGDLRPYCVAADIGADEVTACFTPTPTPSAFGTSTPSPTATATSNGTATATATLTSTVTPTATFTPTVPPTPTPTPAAVCILTEGFDLIASLWGTGWGAQNNSSPVGSVGWHQGDSTKFISQTGTGSSYIASDYNNTGDTGTISNWLLTRPLNLQNGAQLSFWTRTVFNPATFPDRLQVRMSTNGASLNVGNLATDVGDFATLLLDINPSYSSTDYPAEWRNYVVTISGLDSSVTGRLAFRYFVENGGFGGSNSDYIGIDTVVYDCSGNLPTPTPTPMATSTATPTITATATVTPSVSPTPLCPSPTTIFQERFDGVAMPALPSGWVASNATGTDGIFWVTSSFGPPIPAADSLPNSVFINDPSTTHDKRLDSPPIPITGPAQLSFSNYYHLENSSVTDGLGYDGGVLEIRIGAGAFIDIVTASGTFVSGGYNMTISTDFGNPLADRAAWSGNSGGFITTVVNLPATANGQSVQLRWRMGSDNSVSDQGWRIDNVSVLDCLPVATPTPTPTPTVSPTPSTTPSFSISGTVGQCNTSGPSGILLPAVTMTLTGATSSSTATDTSGNYGFSGLAPGNYTITPSKSARPPGSSGINTTDLVAVQRHFLLISLLSGCRLVAADCASPTGITTADVVAIQRYFLALSTGIGNVGKYGFTPTTRTYTPLGSNQTGQNFSTVVFGDVSTPFAFP